MWVGRTTIKGDVLMVWRWKHFFFFLFLKECSTSLFSRRTLQTNPAVYESLSFASLISQDSLNGVVTSRAIFRLVLVRAIGFHRPKGINRLCNWNTHVWWTWLASSMLFKTTSCQLEAAFVRSAVFIWAALLKSWNKYMSIFCWQGYRERLQNLQ